MIGKEQTAHRHVLRLLKGNMLANRQRHGCEVLQFWYCKLSFDALTPIMFDSQIKRPPLLMRWHPEILPEPILDRMQAAKTVSFIVNKHYCAFESDSLSQLSTCGELGVKDHIAAHAPESRTPQSDKTDDNKDEQKYNQPHLFIPVLQQ